jgi:hypothetical protein
MVIMVDGRVLAEGTPADIRGRVHAAGAGEPKMEEAFVAIVEDYRENNQ